MERVVVILIAGIISTFIYFVTKFALLRKKEFFTEYADKHYWIQPNYICVWRTLMAFIAMALFFGADWHLTAIVLYTISAALDGVDGLVARICNKVTELGKWFDPLCDKLTYLPALLGFSYFYDYLSISLICLLISIDLFGQFGVRRLLADSGHSVSATSWGKIKTTVCFILVIYCAIFGGGPIITPIGNGILIIAILLAILSIVSKVPKFNRYLCI